ncbi:MAG TPA: hypothetical protein ENN43_02665, partial [bacterium]|nr:hypothetical protein [bacterium]
MFAGDYNKKGVFVTQTVSLCVHLLIVSLFFLYQQKQRKEAAQYTLTEITMLYELPPEIRQPAAPIERPKSVMDIFKQVIPIKQERQIEMAQPKKIEIERPKVEMQKPEALSLDRSRDDKLKPAAKAIDLDNVIGKKEISPQMVQQQLDLQRQQQLAQAPQQKLDLSQQSSRSSILPAAGRPGISVDASRAPAGLSQSQFKLGQPTPEPKKAAAAPEENIVIQKRSPLVISGQL